MTAAQPSQSHDTRALKAAWGAARFASWDLVIKHYQPAPGNYSPAAIARIDRIWEELDVNALIEARLDALRRGDDLAASRIRGQLLEAGIELNDTTLPVSLTISTQWDLLT